MVQNRVVSHEGLETNFTLEILPIRETQIFILISLKLSASSENNRKPPFKESGSGFSVYDSMFVSVLTF